MSSSPWKHTSNWNRRHSKSNTNYTLYIIVRFYTQSSRPQYSIHYCSFIYNYNYVVQVVHLTKSFWIRMFTCARIRRMDFDKSCAYYNNKVNPNNTIKEIKLLCLIFRVFIVIHTIWLKVQIVQLFCIWINVTLT
jgi:hypothetical protein